MSGLVRSIFLVLPFFLIPKVPIVATLILFFDNNWKKKSATELLPFVPVTATIFLGLFL